MSPDVVEKSAHLQIFFFRHKHNTAFHTHDANNPHITESILVLNCQSDLTGRKYEKNGSKKDSEKYLSNKLES